MKDSLKNLRADLLDRRMRLPLIAALMLMVLGLAYGALGSSGGSSENPEQGGVPATGATPAFATPSGSGKNQGAAVAEATFGRSYQHPAKLVDPFRTIGGSSGKSAKSSKSAAKSSNSKAGSSPSTSGSSKTKGSESPKQETKTKTKTKLVTEYSVNLEFGRAPAIATEAEHLALMKGVGIGGSIPNKSNPMLVLSAASLDAKKLVAGEKGAASATFKLNSANPPIVSGEGSCLPSATQCETVHLEVGQAEQLQYAEANGETVTYVVRPTFVGSFSRVVTVKG